MATKDKPDDCSRHDHTVAQGVLNFKETTT